MLDMFLAYGWIAIAVSAALVAVRIWAKRNFDGQVQDVLSETQARFAGGNVEVHSVKAVRTITVQDETAFLYHIDATIDPSQVNVEWCGADLFLRGTGGDPNQIGDVLNLKRWNGDSFEPLKNKAQLVGAQRLLLSMQVAGGPEQVRFNFNFANFGPVIALPEMEVAV